MHIWTFAAASNILSNATAARGAKVVAIYNDILAPVSPPWP